MKLQEYKDQINIPGVEIFNIKNHIDDSGSFSEILRIEKDSKIAQINCSILHPGTIKAFHLHRFQEDIFYTPNKLILNLVDVRGFENNLDNLNFGIMHRMRIILHSGIAVKVPKSILHGICNPYNKDATLIYFVDQQFNPKDEWRIPWDVVGWDIWDLSKE